MGRFYFTGLIFSTVSAMMSTSAFGWGETGHKIINASAAQLMESPAAAFFQANAANLQLLATTPDLQWKKTATYKDEAPMHFFQWDNYSTSSMGQSLDQYVYSQVVSGLGASYVNTNGSSVWRVDQLYVMMVNALKSGDNVKALQMAGVLGHYVGDLSQPMHDTADYDGQSIGRRGIHMYFETTLVGTEDPSSLTTEVVNAGGPIRQTLDSTYANSPETSDQLVRTIVMQEGIEAYGQLSNVLSDFSASSQDDAALKQFFGPRMGAGAANLSKIWDAAVVESGVQSFPAASINVSEPKWFALQDPSKS